VKIKEIMVLVIPFILLNSCLEKQVFPFIKPDGLIGTQLQDRRVYIYISSNLKIIGDEKNFKKEFNDKRDFSARVFKNLKYYFSPTITLIEDSIVTRYLQDLEPWSQREFDNYLVFFAKRNNVDIIIKIMDFSLDIEAGKVPYSASAPAGPGEVPLIMGGGSYEAIEIKCEVYIDDFISGKTIADFRIKGSKEVYGESKSTIADALGNLTERLDAYIREGKTKFKSNSTTSFSF